MNKEPTHVISLGPNRYVGNLHVEGNYQELLNSAQVHSGIGQTPQGAPALMVHILPVDGCVGGITLRNIKPDYIIEIADLDADDKKVYAAAYKEYTELLVKIRAQRSGIITDA